MLRFLGGSVVKNIPAKQEMQVWSLGEGNENPLHIFAWEIPWTEESGELKSVV